MIRQTDKRSVAIVNKNRLAEASITKKDNTRFLIVYVIAVLMFIGVFAELLLDPYGESDHFAAIPRDGDPNWYHDVSYGASPEILDEDLFINGIGGSIAAVKAADLVFLGPSTINFAIDGDVLKSTLETP